MYMYVYIMGVPFRALSRRLRAFVLEAFEFLMKLFAGQLPARVHCEQHKALSAQTGRCCRVEFAQPKRELECNGGLVDL